MWSFESNMVMLLVLNIFLLGMNMKSLLMLFLSFEMLMLNMVFLFFVGKTPFEVTSMLMIFMVAAAEAAVGLSFLVTLMRSKTPTKKNTFLGFI